MCFCTPNFKFTNQLKLHSRNVEKHVGNGGHAAMASSDEDDYET